MYQWGTTLSHGVSGTIHSSKTKELVVDLRRKKVPWTPVSIQGVSMDIVKDYTYLGVLTDYKLDWIKNTNTLYKKGQTRLCFLRWLRSFSICQTMLRMLESILTSVLLCAEGSGCQKTEQTAPQGQWHCGSGAGLSDGSVREKNQIKSILFI